MLDHGAPGWAPIGTMPVATEGSAGRAGIDAVRLAKLLAASELVLVTIPSVEREVARSGPLSR